MKKGHPKLSPVHVVAHEAKEKAEHADNKKQERQPDQSRQDQSRPDNAVLYEKKQHHPDGPGGNYRGL